MSHVRIVGGGLTGILAAFEAHRPDVVFHAAALKHLPMLERYPAEGWKTNVLGTLNVLRCAQQVGVQHLVNISTDKAADPTSVLGQTKRLAERLTAWYAVRYSKMYLSVRFGNVLGSRGSVLYTFKAQIERGGPVTVTHPDVTRFFMTIPEAAQLVIQAGAMASGGDVFVLDMGQPVRIMDLAQRMVELSGLSVRNATNTHGDIEIQLTGLRPGEKLYEELLIGDNPLPTKHPRIMKANEDYLPMAELVPLLRTLTLALNVNDVPLIRSLLKEMVPGYQPESEVVDWVYLARAGSVH